MKKYTKKKVTEFLMESNAIEGVYGPVGLKNAQKAWDYLVKAKKMTSAVVLETHRLLMQETDLLPQYVGVLRDCPVWVGGREGMKSQYLKQAIESWCLEMNQRFTCKVPGCKDEWSESLHVIYEKVHPFADGNGRTGRMFMNWWRMKHDLPILIIHEGDEQMAYYQWFKEYE